MAIGSGGAFTTVEPSLHTKTNIEVIKMFLDVKINLEQLTRKVWKVAVNP
jgi:RNA 3'-terminal phosphate cyclase (ATP)